MRQTIDSAYILHTMAYQETNAIVRMLSEEHGMVSGVLRDVYQQQHKAQQRRAALQLASLVECQWQGESGLKQIRSIELINHSQIKQAKQLVCLSYVNELLLHFLPAEQSATAIYHAYAWLIDALQAEAEIEVVLRRFEQILFEEMGCTVDYLWDNSSNESIQANKTYCLNPEQGVIMNDGVAQGLLLRTDELQLLAVHDYSCIETRRLAKHVHRTLIDYHLAGKPLKARSLYRQL